MVAAPRRWRFDSYNGPFMATSRPTGRAEITTSPKGLADIPYLLVRFITRGEFIPKSSLISGYDPLQAFHPCKKY